jgi:hypothetical protein
MQHFVEQHAPVVLFQKIISFQYLLPIPYLPKRNFEYHFLRDYSPPPAMEFFFSFLQEVCGNFQFFRREGYYLLLH